MPGAATVIRGLAMIPDQSMILGAPAISPWVACSGDSPDQHAKTRYEETGHPLARRLEPGSRWR